ncbi:hypothetical protein C8R34_10917 [Nitrosomonas sp. Nm84]|nr:hypothetical protein C8R34_10917 [Nitrosomonas sp. Nm84]
MRISGLNDASVITLGSSFSIYTTMIEFTARDPGRAYLKTNILLSQLMMSREPTAMTSTAMAFTE